MVYKYFNNKKKKNHISLLMWCPKHSNSKLHHLFRNTTLIAKGGTRTPAWEYRLLTNRGLMLDKQFNTRLSISNTFDCAYGPKSQQMIGAMTRNWCRSADCQIVFQWTKLKISPLLRLPYCNLSEQQLTTRLPIGL